MIDFPSFIRLKFACCDAGSGEKIMDKQAGTVEVEESSGNVFADLGLPNSEERQIKSLLAIQIRELLDHKDLNQAEAAYQLDLSADDMTAIMRGRLSELTLDQLFRCLTRLGRSVEVRVLSGPEEAHLTVVMA